MVAFSRILNDDDDDAFLLLFALHQRQVLKGRRCRILFNRSPNIERGRHEAALRLLNDYWGGPGRMPTYTDSKMQPLLQNYIINSTYLFAGQFRRRFRMRKTVFERIVESLTEHDDYFLQKPDAAQRMGFTSIQKVTAAMRMLAYGSSADQLDEVIRMGETTVLECLKRFVKGVRELFEKTYLREPTVEDMNWILQDNAKRGFPGMIGSLDCMHWEWQNCPYAWKGAYSGRSGHPTIVLEAVCDRRLWIWHSFFGVEGSNNDLNVLNRSPLLDRLLKGTMPSTEFTVNGATFTCPYYLVDGIYPEWAVFQSSISHPQGNKKKLFSKVQEALRKDIERCFGTLQAQFRILSLPCKLWAKDVMDDIITACMILHNMVVEDEFDVCFEDNEDDLLHGFVRPAMVRTLSAAGTRAVMSKIEDKTAFHKLRNELIEHLWSQKGDEDD